MSKIYEEITPELMAWLQRQHMFFVATAPLAADGHINCSPKGLDTLRILGPTQVAYLDLTGSGAETIAHVRENGRIVFMFCAFSGPPNIVRLHGRATVHTHSSADWTTLAQHFPAQSGARAVIVADITRISDSCGYAVPTFDYMGERDALLRWSDNKGAVGLQAYRSEHNARSIDSLPGLDQVRKRWHDTARTPTHTATHRAAHPRALCRKQR